MAAGLARRPRANLAEIAGAHAAHSAHGLDAMHAVRDSQHGRRVRLLRAVDAVEIVPVAQLPLALHHQRLPIAGNDSLHGGEASAVGRAGVVRAVLRRTDFPRNICESSNRTRFPMCRSPPRRSPAPGQNGQRFSALFPFALQRANLRLLGAGQRGKSGRLNRQIPRSKMRLDLERLRDLPIYGRSPQRPSRLPQRAKQPLLRLSQRHTRLP